METRTLTLYQRLYYSFRLGGLSKILLPTILGQIVGFKVTGNFQIFPAFLGVVLGFLCLSSIVFLNDIADEKVDTLKRKLFPKESSPKTLTDKLLPRKSVLLLALGSSLLFVCIGFAIKFYYDLKHFGIFSFYAIFLNFSYSFWPLKLNYRFGGELMEAFGVGMFLPYINSYLQSSQVWHSHYFFFIGLFFWALGQAIASGVCDLISDRQGGKKTLSVLLGNRKSVLLILLSFTSCSFSWFFISKITEFNLTILLVVTLLIILFYMPHFMRYIKQDSLETEIKAQKEYRDFNHKIAFLFSSIFIIHLLFF